MADSAGRYHLGTPALMPGSYTIRVELPAGHDTTGWRVLKNGLDYVPGRSAVVAFDSTETIRIDFVRGEALAVPPTVSDGPLLRVWRPQPNPARAGASVRLPYALREAAKLRFSVYDIHGRLVSRLIEGWGAPGAGAIELPLNGARTTGLAPGVYFISVVARSASGGTAAWNSRLVVLN